MTNCDLNYWNEKRFFDDLRFDEVLTLRRRLAEIVERTSIVYDNPSVDQLIYDIAGIHLIATGEMDKLTEGYNEREV